MSTYSSSSSSFQEETQTKYFSDFLVNQTSFSTIIQEESSNIDEEIHQEIHETIDEGHETNESHESNVTIENSTDINPNEINNKMKKDEKTIESSFNSFDSTSSGKKEPVFTTPDMKTKENILQSVKMNDKINENMNETNDNNEENNENNENNIKDFETIDEYIQYLENERDTFKELYKSAKQNEIESLLSLQQYLITLQTQFTSLEHEKETLITQLNQQTMLYHDVLQQKEVITLQLQTQYLENNKKTQEFQQTIHAFTTQIQSLTLEKHQLQDTLTLTQRELLQAETICQTITKEIEFKNQQLLMLSQQYLDDDKEETEENDNFNAVTNVSNELNESNESSPSNSSELLMKNQVKPSQIIQETQTPMTMKKESHHSLEISSSDSDDNHSEIEEGDDDDDDDVGLHQSIDLHDISLPSIDGFHSLNTSIIFDQSMEQHANDLVEALDEELHEELQTNKVELEEEEVVVVVEDEEQEDDNDDDNSELLSSDLLQATPERILRSDTLLETILQSSEKKKSMIKSTNPSLKTNIQNDHRLSDLLIPEVSSTSSPSTTNNQLQTQQQQPTTPSILKNNEHLIQELACAKIHFANASYELENERKKNHILTQKIALLVSWIKQIKRQMLEEREQRTRSSSSVSLLSYSTNTTTSNNNTNTTSSTNNNNNNMFFPTIPSRKASIDRNNNNIRKNSTA